MSERGIQCAVRLSEDENKELEEICKELHTSKAGFIRFAIFNTLAGINKERIHYE